MLFGMWCVCSILLWVSEMIVLVVILVVMLSRVMLI